MARPDVRLIVNNVAAMTVAAGVEHYLQRIAARGKARNTIAAYGADLAHYTRFVAQLQHGDLVAVQSSRHVSRFLDDQDARGVSKRSQARRLCTLRSFFKHARREGWIGHDPTHDESVTWSAVRVMAPEMDALHAVIDAIPRNGDLNLRDRAVLRLMLDTGLRITPTRQLDVPGFGSPCEVDLKRQLAHYVGKGGAAYSKPFNDSTLRFLEAWLPRRAEMVQPGCAALFVSQRGARLCRETIHQIIVKRGEACGIKLHAHLLRHRRGVHVIESCGDKVAQQFLDHASLSTTSQYGRHANGVTFAMLRDRADIDAGRAAHG